MSGDTINAKPTTHQANLTKLPRALGAAARAAAMGDMAMDAEAGRWLAKAALYGDTSGATRQRNGSQYLGEITALRSPLCRPDMVMALPMF